MSAGEYYPFLSFKFDTKTLQANTWLAFGEAMSKCEHLAGVPLKPKAAQDLSSIYLRKGVQATVAIEGNTLSDDEVQRIVDKGTANVPESRQYLEQEVQNVLAAVREIDENLSLGYRSPITVERLLDLNGQVLRDIPDEPEVLPGRLRQHNVTAGPYRAPDWQEVPELMRQFVKWLDELRISGGTTERREDRFIQSVLAAILAHLYIAWIHGFGNGNGRVARLVEVQILSESGVVPVVATNLLSNFYNKTRSEYYRHLNLAQHNVADFVHYAVRGYRDELREQIGSVRAESLAIHWESYVYEVFRRTTQTKAKDRQRELALAMPYDRFLEPEAATLLTTQLAKRYAKCGERVPARDLNDLAKLGLVERHGREYRARREVIEAFLPPVAASTA